jgi:antirestriction protein ArdC
MSPATKKGKRERVDAYELAATAVLGAMDRGTVPWRMPWSQGPGAIPQNPHWRERIGEDPRLVVIAAQRAQHACDRILGPDQDQDEASTEAAEVTA